MNPDNVGSLEACKKLLAAGIVLETEAHWHPIYEREEGSFTAIKIIGWILHPYPLKANSIPAVSLADAWRELQFNGFDWSMYLVGTTTWISINNPEYSSVEFQNTNPTDALIELRIWLEGQRKEKNDA